MTKLPPDLRLRIARETDKEVWEIAELMAVIKREVEARKATELVKLPHAKSGSHYRNPFPPLLQQPLLLQVAQPSGVSTAMSPTILLRVTKFKVFKNVELYSSNLVDVLIASELIINQESVNHPKLVDTVIVSTTSLPVKEQIHLRLIVLTKPTERPTVPLQVKSPLLLQIPQINKTVLLQTAHAIALATPSDPSSPVHILFDSGSQLSYITERLRQQLNLKPTRIEKLCLNTFGHQGYKTQSCAVGLLLSYICEDFTRRRQCIDFSIHLFFPTINNQG